jgi:hypothetical protein
MLCTDENKHFAMGHIESSFRVLVFWDMPLYVLVDLYLHSPTVSNDIGLHGVISEESNLKHFALSHSFTDFSFPTHLRYT